MRSFLICLLAACFAFTAPLNAAEAAADPFKVLPLEDEFADQSIMLLKHLQRQPIERSWEREVELARIRNEDDWKAYKEHLLRDYRKILGLPFPERTPLNPEVTRVLDRGAYRIENVIYQSTPGINVTANLYVPQAGEPPFPGILFPCGHWHEGKAAAEYHSAALGLVQKGYVVLLFDPVGQGERCDYFKADGSLVTQEPVIEHTLLANPLFLIGKHLMAVRMWDAIRGIDYLESRPEVDPQRIGCTGNSGGGTETVHLVPLEERIKVAVPDGTVDSPVLSLGAGGIGDGEQNRPWLVPYGITMADLMMLAWPRPCRLIIESRGGVHTGTLAGFGQAEFLYRTLGHPERMSLVETEWPHGFFKFSRQKMYAWFNKWFYDRDTGWEEPELKLEKPEDLLCTKSGQIVAERGQSIQQWTAAQAAKVLPEWKIPKNTAEFTLFREMLRDGVQEALNNPADSSAAHCQPLGETQRGDISIEKLALYSEADIYLPALLFKPTGRDKFPVVILADSKGKTADGGALALKLAAAGYGVLAVDLRSYGETKITHTNPDRDGAGGLMAQTLGVEASVAYDGLKLGRSIFAMRVFDLLKTTGYLMSRPDVDKQAGLALIGRSTCGPISLYAAALDQRIKAVLTDSSLVSFMALTRPGVYSYHFIDFLPRALCYNDFTHLAGALAPGAFWSLNSLDQCGKLEEQKSLVESYAFTRDCFRMQKAMKKFQIRSYMTMDQRLDYSLEWARSVF